MNPFLRYLADKNSAHRHTPMITRPCGLRRAGNYTVIQNPKNSGVYLLHFSTFTPELAELNMMDIDSSIMNTSFGKHIPNLNVLRM